MSTRDFPQHSTKDKPCSGVEWMKAQLDKGAPTSWGLIADPEDIYLTNDGYAVLDNSEYAGPIRFCPWCGEDVSTPKGQP